MAGESDDPWDSYVADCDNLAERVKRSSAVNVNSKPLRQMAQSTVQNYFRSARPDLLGLGITEPDLSELDGHLQNLNQLSHGNNAKTSYLKELKGVRKINVGIASQRAMRIGMRGNSAKRLEISNRDKKIIDTLHGLVPSASLSFEQALLDRADKDRKSFRGTAVELREALREVIDHFAPDQDVMKAPSFKLEKDRTKPTTRQKMRFILKARDQTSKVINTTDETLERLDIGSEKLARAIQDRSSLATHVAASRKEIANVYRYVETILAELLEIDE